MKRFWSIFERMRITPKIFLLTFVCLESLTILLAFSSNIHSSAILVDSQMNNARQTLQKSNRYLDLNLQNVRTTMKFIEDDSRLQSGDYKQLETWLMRNLIYLTPNISNIHCISDGAVLSSSSAHSWDLLTDPVVEQIASDIKTEPTWVGPYYSKVSGYTLTYVSPVKLNNGRAGALLADINLEGLYYALFPDDPSNLAGNLMLLDQKMNPVFGKAPYVQYDYISHQYHFSGFDQTLLRSNWSQTEAVNQPTHDSVILTRGYNSILNWQLVMVINKDDLLAPLKKSVRYSWTIAAIAFLLSIGLSLLIAALISRPIKSISKSVKEMGEGNLNAHITLNRKDEIGYLALQFNLLTRKIGQLLVDLRYSEEQKKLSDFRALHAQIKPHFLYNTLNSISMFGRRGDSQRMDQLIAALTNQLHYALDNSPDPITLREELTAVENYMELMKIRYPDKYRFEMDIDPLSLEYKLPKFILQPLVENAIFHGIVPNQQGGHVYIGTMVDDDDWEILIEDNGIGMDEETLEGVKSKLEYPGTSPKSAEHIGILNIHERFWLMFGKSYLITIESQRHVGTKIWIKLPKERMNSDETPSLG